RGPLIVLGIILTASLMIDVRNELENYCQGFLTKPLIRADLVKALKGILTLRPKPDFSFPHFSNSQAITDSTSNAITEDLSLLPELISKLKTEEETVWPRLCQTMIMKELRRFVKRLQVLSEEYPFIILINYTSKLDLQIKEFDADNLKYTMNNFPNIRHSLEQLL
ncbi:MAG: hypothetical protein ACK58N_09790, partial [Synechocystis sp.]